MIYPSWGSRGLMDRESDFRQELSVGGVKTSVLSTFNTSTESRPLSKSPDPQLLPGRRSIDCPLLRVCVHLDGLNAEHKFHCWLYSV